jgi:hypothetical protein
MLASTWNVAVTVSPALVVSVTVYSYAGPPGNGADAEISLGVLTLNVPVIVALSAATLQTGLKLGEKKYGLLALSEHEVTEVVLVAAIVTNVPAGPCDGVGYPVLNVTVAWAC